MSTPESPDPSERLRQPVFRDEEVLEPTGPPSPSPVLETAAWSISTLLAVATGAVVAPLFMPVTRTQGATRSAHIEWERRAQQISKATEQATQETQSTPLPSECSTHDVDE